MRIEICGGIASGKTSLANLLRENRFTAVNEQLTSGTFLNEFYTKAELYKFETELSFVLHHSVEMKKHMEDGAFLACDFSFEQDFAYAMNNLNYDELQIFGDVYKEIKRQIGEPILIIRIHCSVTERMKRIKLRGRVNEQAISQEYLQESDRLIDERLKQIDIPVMYISSEEYDFRDIEKNSKPLLMLLRKYCNLI